MIRLSVEDYARFILRRRWLAIALSILAMLAVSAGALHISTTNDIRSLADEDSPEIVALNALEGIYSRTNIALIAVAPKKGSVFTRATLAAIEDLTEAAWETPYSTRVDSLTNFNHTWAEGDDLIVEPLVDGARELSGEDIERIEKIALNEPELAGRLVSPDGRVAGMVITFNLTGNELEAAAEISGYLNRVLEKARASHPGTDYRLTGDVIMNHVTGQTAEEDRQTLGPAAFLIILIASALLLRSLFGTIAIVVVMLSVIQSTMGLVGWTGTVLTPVNAGLPIIVMTVAVAHSVHIITQAQYAMGDGRDKNAAIVESLRINAWPVFLTAATTIVGFLSLNASDSPPFRVLGNFVAFGMFCAFLYSMILLPALLSVLPLRARAGGGGTGFFDRFGAFVVARRAVLLWGAPLLVIGLVAGIPRIELTDTWTKLFDERYEFRRDTDFVIDNLTGMETLEYSLSSGREGGISDPDYLRKVDAFAEWYRKQPEVSHVQAFSDIMKRLNKTLHGDDPAYYRLPGDPRLAAQYLLLYELSLPLGKDLNNRVDVGKSATRMTVVIESLTAQAQREIEARAQEWIRANAPGLAGRASGITIVLAHLSQRNIESMLRGTAIAMALISLILIFVFRSVRLGLVSLLPNFVPAAMSIGLWGYLVGNLGMAGSITTAMAFGIIVDDTIHFMTKYRKARREGQPATEAVRTTFRTVGQAMWTTTAVLSLGFLVFASSGFEVSWTLGLLVTLTITIALLADFLLLPPLLMAIDRTKER